MRARRRPVLTGAEEMIGSVGEVVHWAGGTGRVRVHGEIWAAQSGAMPGRGPEGARRPAAPASSLRSSRNLKQ